MDENEVKREEQSLTIPYVLHESDMSRAERTIARLIGVIILLAIGLIGTNAFWIYEWMQYDYVNETTTTSTTVDQASEGNGTNNYIGNEGDINNGTTKSDENDNNTEDITNTKEQ